MSQSRAIVIVQFSRHRHRTPFHEQHAFYWQLSSISLIPGDSELFPIRYAYYVLNVPGTIPHDATDSLIFLELSPCRELPARYGTFHLDNSHSAMHHALQGSVFDPVGHMTEFNGF
jgi:hypothetical protein